MSTLAAIANRLKQISVMQRVAISGALYKYPFAMQKRANFGHSHEMRWCSTKDHLTRRFTSTPRSGADERHVIEPINNELISYRFVGFNYLAVATKSS